MHTVVLNIMPIYREGIPLHKVNKHQLVDAQFMSHFIWTKIHILSILVKNRLWPEIACICTCLDETAFSQSKFNMFVACLKLYRFFMSCFKKSEIHVGNFSVNKSELGYPETYFWPKIGKRWQELHQTATQWMTWTRN